MRGSGCWGGEEEGFVLLSLPDFWLLSARDGASSGKGEERICMHSVGVDDPSIQY